MDKCVKCVYNGKGETKGGDPALCKEEGLFGPICKQYKPN